MHAQEHGAAQPLHPLLGSQFYQPVFSGVSLIPSDKTFLGEFQIKVLQKKERNNLCSANAMPGFNSFLYIFIY